MLVFTIAKHQHYVLQIANQIVVCCKLVIAAAAIHRQAVVLTLFHAGGGKYYCKASIAKQYCKILLESSIVKQHNLC